MHVPKGKPDYMPRSWLGITGSVILWRAGHTTQSKSGVAGSWLAVGAQKGG